MSLEDGLLKSSPPYARFLNSTWSIVICALAFVVIEFTQLNLAESASNFPINLTLGIGVGLMTLFGFRLFAALLLGVIGANVMLGQTVTASLFTGFSLSFCALLGSYSIRSLRKWLRLEDYTGEILSLAGGAVISGGLLGLVHQSVAASLSGVCGVLLFSCLSNRTIFSFPTLKLGIRVVAVSCLIIPVATLVFSDSSAYKFFFLLPIGIVLIGFAGGRRAITLSTLMSVSVLLYLLKTGASVFGSSVSYDEIFAIQILLIVLACNAVVVSELAKTISIQKFIGPIMLVLGLAGWAFFTYSQAETRQSVAKMEELVSAANVNVADRLDSFLSVIYGVKGLFDASAYVSLDEWNSYMSSQQVDVRYPSLFAISFIRRIPRGELNSYQTKQNSRGRKDFVVRALDGGIPRSEGDHFVIQYEYSLKFDRGVLGVDLSTSPVRNEAILAAQNSGALSVSAPLVLLGDKTQAQSMFVAVPVFSPSIGKKTADTLDLFGVVAAPFQVSAVVGKVNSIEAGFLNVVVSHPATNSLLFDSSISHQSRKTGSAQRKDLLSTNEKKFAQQTLKFEWSPGPRFPTGNAIQSAVFVALGEFVALLLAWIFVSAATRESRTASEVEAKTRQISEKEKIWRALTNSVPVGIYQTDALGACIYVNPAWERIAGLDHKGALGDGWLNAIHPEDKGQLYSAWESFSAGRQTFRAKFRFLHPNGTERWVDSLAEKTFDDSGNVAAIVGIAIDISEQLNQAKVMEDERLRSFHNAKMASLGQMAGGVAHEINNPLAIISGFAFQARGLLETNPDPKLLKIAIEKISNTTDRIARIVSGLRMVSRGAENDPMTPFYLLKVVDETLELCIEKFRSNAIVFERVGDFGVTLNGRSGQIAQIVLNLLQNSLDAVQGVENPRIRIEAEKTQTSMVLRVIDNGPRIPDIIAQKIMEPFFTTKEVGKGTGLGLSISRKLADDHGGRLILDRANKETCFELSLPLYEVRLNSLESLNSNVDSSTNSPLKIKIKAA